MLVFWVNFDRGKYMKEKLEKLRLLNYEISRRKSFDNLSRYNTGKKVHQKQLAFHKCKKKNR